MVRGEAAIGAERKIGRTRQREKTCEKQTGLIPFHQAPGEIDTETESSNRGGKVRVGE